SARPPCGQAPRAWTPPAPTAGASGAPAGAPSRLGAWVTSCVSAWLPSCSSFERGASPAPSRRARQAQPLRRPGQHQHIARLEGPIGVGQLVPALVLLPAWMHGEDGDAVACPAVDFPQRPPDPALRDLDRHHPITVGPLRLDGLEPIRDRGGP